MDAAINLKNNNSGLSLNSHRSRQDILVVIREKYYKKFGAMAASVIDQCLDKFVKKNGNLSLDDFNAIEKDIAYQLRVQEANGMRQSKKNRSAMDHINADGVIKKQ